jgi:hypothetical protein
VRNAGTLRGTGWRVWGIGGLGHRRRNQFGARNVIPIQWVGEPAVNERK